MLGVYLVIIGIIIAAFGAIFPFQLFLRFNLENGSQYLFNYGNGSSSITPLMKLLKRDAWIGLPFVVAGIALQVIGLLIEVQSQG